MHALILAGGFGTRLRSAVPDVPKPLAPIKGRTFLDWLIEALVWYGATGVTLSVHYEWEKIRDHFEENRPPVPLNLAIEKTPLGTGGGMKFALKECPQDSPVMVLNGDSFARIDYRALYRDHAKSGLPLTMVLRQMEDTGRYGRVEEEDGVITSFEDGKPGRAGLINAGIYVLDPKLFSDTKLPAAFSFEKDFLPKRLEKIQPAAFITDDYFIDIGIPEDYERVRKNGFWRPWRAGDFA